MNELQMLKPPVIFDGLQMPDTWEEWIKLIKAEFETARFYPLKEDEDTLVYHKHYFRGGVPAYIITVCICKEHCWPVDPDRVDDVRVEFMCQLLKVESHTKLVVAQGPTLSQFCEMSRVFHNGMRRFHPLSSRRNSPGSSPSK